MKICMNIFFMILIIFNFEIGNSAENLQVEADKWLGTNRVKTFNDIVDQLKIFKLPSLRGLSRIGTTWDIELEKSKNRFIEAKSKEDVYYALLSLKNTMHDYHSKPLGDPELRLKISRVVLPITFRPAVVDGKTNYVVATSAISLIKPGFILKMLDGKTTTQWEEYFLEWTNTTSPEYNKLLTSKWLANRSSDDLPIPEPKSLSKLTFYDSKQKNDIETQMYWENSSLNFSTEGCLSGEFSSDYRNYSPKFKGVNFCVFPNIKGVFVIKYYSFSYDYQNNIPRLWNKISKLTFTLKPIGPDKDSSDEIANQDLHEIQKLLKLYKPKKVLIDVRENFGGNVYSSFIGLFAKKPFLLLKRQLIFSDYLAHHSAFTKEAMSLGDKEMLPLILEAQKKNEKIFPVFPFFCRSKECSVEEALYQPTPYISSEFKTAVLVGPKCVSACDQFVAIMKDNGIAKIIGLPTNGGHSPFRAFLPIQLVNGAILKLKITVGEGIRPNGEPLEGNPAIPDFRIEFQENYLNKAIEFF